MKADEVGGIFLHAWRKAVILADQDQIWGMCDSGEVVLSEPLLETVYQLLKAGPTSREAITACAKVEEIAKLEYSDLFHSAWIEKITVIRSDEPFIEFDVEYRLNGVPNAELTRMQVLYAGPYTVVSKPMYLSDEVTE